MFCFSTFAGDFRSDIRIVRAILDSNNVTAPVWSVATVKGGRVVALHFNECFKQPRRQSPGSLNGIKISKIPAIINGLDALDTLEISFFFIDAKLTLPPDVNGLSGLRKLSIRGAALDSIPDGFSKLFGLQTLILSADKLRQFPEAVTMLPHLVELDLSENAIHSIPKSIGSMHHLRSLKIGTQEIDTVFSIAPELALDSLLQILDISSNKLADLPSSIFQLKHLLELHVENCQLSDLPDAIGLMQELTYLNLSWNKLAGLPAGLGNVKSLKELIVVLNPLDSFPSVICELSHLTLLNLQECGLKSLPAAIGGLTLLQEMNVCYNQISFVPGEIKNLKNVTTLRLHNNNLSSLPEGITELTPHNWLSLKNNPLFNPCRIDPKTSRWLCLYDVTWGTDFNVCNIQTSVIEKSLDKKRQAVFTATGATAHYNLFAPAQVSLKLYDMQGRLLKVLRNCSQASGVYDIGIPPAFAARMCILALKVDGAEQTRVLSSVK
jgi:Leucine-rich repeat (LRR) protein